MTTTPATTLGLRRRTFTAMVVAALALSTLAVPDAAASTTEGRVPDYSGVQLQARTNLLVNDEGWNVPPGSSFNSISPAISDAGHVAFPLQVVPDPDGGPTTAGVWLGGDGEGGIVVREGTISPSVSINAHGDIGFNVTAGVGNSTLHIYDAEAGESGPVGTSPVVPNSYGVPDITDDGDLLFQANFGGGRAYAGRLDGEGVFFAQDDGLDPDSPYTFFYTPSGNNADQIAAKVATSSDMTSELEIRLFEADGSSELLLGNVGADPASPFATFDNSLALNDLGHIAVVGELEDGGARTLVRADGETVTTIATAGEGPILSFDFFAPAINDDGLVAFRAVDEQGQAIYVGDGETLTRVVGNGDVVETDLGTGQLGQHDTSPVFGGSPSINDHGDVVFTAGLHPEGDNQVEWGSGVMVALAERVDEPAIEVSPESFDVEVSEFDVETVDLEIANVGEAELVWEIATGASCDEASDVPVSADPSSGATAPGDIAVTTVEIDATQLIPGSYLVALCVASNDPDTPLVEVPVAFTVTPVEVDPPDEVVEVSVDPEATDIAVDETVDLSATAVYDSGESFEVTESAEWSSSDDAVATVTDGVVTGVAEGVVEVTAAFGGVSGVATVTVTDEGDDPEPPDPGEPDPGEPLPEGVVRVSGSNRFETAITISQATFGDGEAGSVVLARADDFADSLAGTPLAVDRDAPVLLTVTDTLIDIVADEIGRVLPAGGTVYLLGGTAALDASVEADLVALGYTPVRLAGPERIGTSLAVANELAADPGEILITNGFNFPDALAAGAAAAEVDGVVILTTPDTPDAQVDAFLTDNPTATITAVGGPAARAYPDATPVFGPTRETTAVAVAEAFFDTPAAIAVARQDDFADALAGGAHIGRLGGPLLLTPDVVLHPDTEAYLCANAESITTGFVYGGTAAVSDEVTDLIGDAIDGLACP